MQKVLFWARSRAGMSADEFRRYWIETHAPLARASFAKLQSYEVNIVTGTLEGEPFLSGLAELYWETRDAFLRDIASPAGKRVLDDVQNFASEGGPLLVDEHPVLAAGRHAARVSPSGVPAKIGR